MVFGRRKESADDETEPWEHVEPAAARRRRPVPPADRRRVGLAGQHLHHRRLRQLARRQVRQERRLGEVVGRRRAPGPGQFNTAARDRDRPQRQHLRRRSHEPAHPGVRHRRQVPADVHDRRAARSRTRAPSTATRRPASVWRRSIGAPNSICITPGPNQVLFVGESTFPGRIFKVVARRQGARRDRPVRAASSKQFSGAHALACPSENEIYVGRDVELARAEADTASRNNWKQTHLRM